MLNAATFRVENSVKFVLLDDAVLVARKRTRRTADRPLFVAERSWPLNDILVLDTKDTPSEYIGIMTRLILIHDVGRL